jgi:hypothetical protein
VQVLLDELNEVRPTPSVIAVYQDQKLQGPASMLLQPSAELVAELVGFGVLREVAERMVDAPWLVATVQGGGFDLLERLGEAGQCSAHVSASGQATSAAAALLHAGRNKELLHEALVAKLDSTAGDALKGVTALRRQARVVTADRIGELGVSQAVVRHKELLMLSDRRALLVEREAHVVGQSTGPGLRASAKVTDLGTVTGVTVRDTSVDLVFGTLDERPMTVRSSHTETSGYRYVARTLTVSESVGSGVLVTLADLPGDPPELTYAGPVATYWD